MRSTLLSTVACLAFGSAFAQYPAPAPPQQAPVLIKNGTVHVGNGQVYPNGYVLLDKGKIVSVGAGAPTQLPQGVQTVDATGKHIYPGLVWANNSLGLDETAAVRATRDYAETGSIHPEVVAATAYNAASLVIPTIRANGVLTVESVPQGGLVCGKSSLMQLDAWTAPDATLVPEVSLHITFPPRFVNTGWWAEPGEIKPNEGRPSQLEALRSVFADAKAYAATTHSAKDRNLRLEAMQAVFTGKTSLTIHTYGAPREVVEAVLFAESFGISRIVVSSDATVAKVAPFLKEHKVPVVLSRIHALPSRDDADYNEALRAPAKLRAAGVDFCLDMSGDMETMQGRNLGLIMESASGNGLTDEQALEAVTLAPARILGQQGRIGSLEAGKDATLFINSGPITDFLRTHVETAYIQGRATSLETHQKALYRRYAARYGQPVVE